MSDILLANLLSPVPLAFALGVLARLLKSELSLPKDIYTALGIYLLFALGLKGGVALAQAPLSGLALPVLITLLLGIVRPLTSYAVLRRLGRFSTADSAGIAAHYGSVSAVTFIAAITFVDAVGSPAEGFLATLLAILESPGIAIALFIGSMHRAGDRALGRVAHEVLTGRTMILLVGGLVIGWISGPTGFAEVQPFFEGLFKGALVLFLLEMGIIAGERLGDLRRTGAFLIAFGLLLPIVHGLLGAWLGTLAGLSVGGATVLASMAASASYIAAPPAVRLTLPEANPTLSITASLAITFPFNLLLGIPLYYRFAEWFAPGGTPWI